MPGRLPTVQISRLRLIVIQALVFSLLATLGVRLFYLQVSHGATYRAQAASQSVREVVHQPVRGLIVDDEGRPLVTNRSAWVVSLDQEVLDGLSDADRATLLKRVAKAIDVPVKDQEEMVKDWSGTNYQPVPVATDVKESVALRILEQPEDYPGVVAEKETLRSYPRPYGINAAGLLGYLTPITDSEYHDAKKRDDQSVNNTSLVGRSGVEKTYDEWLRGMPGYDSVVVDSMGREIGTGESLPAQPGDTLVTSIDAKLQGTVEKQLHQALVDARKRFDPKTGHNLVADSGAAVVMEAKTGRIVAMASEPTYDPEDWVGGISTKEYKRLNSKKADYPLLSRALNGQFPPGSTWKPFMTTAALSNGFSSDTRLECSPGLQVGNRYFDNFEGESYGMIDFATALRLSCDTFFYRVGMHFWQKYGSNPRNVDAKDPLVSTAESWGFGKPTGVDLPGESSGRVADRHWKLAYYKQMKDYYCRMDKKGNAPSSFLRVYAHEFCLEGYYYRLGDAVNFSIGQGDTMVTPLQLARAYSAMSNGGTLYQPTVGKAIVSSDGTVLKEIKPKAVKRPKVKKSAIAYVNNGLIGTTTTGTLAWKFLNFPADKIRVRGKTGSAEVLGKSPTTWVATYDKKYVVVMMATQGDTGSGTVGEYVRRIWEALYGIKKDTPEIDPAQSVFPGDTPPAQLPKFGDDGSILPPGGRKPDQKAGQKADQKAEGTKR